MTVPSLLALATRDPSLLRAIPHIPPHGPARYAAAASPRPAGADTSAGPRDLDVRSLPFVGRVKEWSALLAAFERSRLGGPEVAIVEGATGVGKTRLISQFSHAAKGEDADVMVG